MKPFSNYSNYNNALSLIKKDVLACSHGGDCTESVNAVMLKPYVKRQLALINPEQLRKELNGYGAWSDEELLNHQDNLQRFVWISAGDIQEYKKIK